MKNFTLHIPKPCHEDWDKMTPAANGRHCASCCKTVVDFTLMSDAQIKAYFLSHGEQRTCGHFNASQLAPSRSFLQKKLDLLHRYIDTRITSSFVKTAAFFFLGICASLAGCEKNNTGETRRDPMPAVKDTITEQPLTGDTVYVAPPKTGEPMSVLKDTSCELLQGNVIYIEDPPVMGKVER